MQTLSIQALPAGGFPDKHKHFLGIIGLIPKKEDVGPCLSCGQGRIIRFTVGVQQSGSQELTPHVTGQACNVCGYSQVHLEDTEEWLRRHGWEWFLIPLEERQV